MQQRVGLHHLCLRARSREDVDRCAALLKEIGANIVRGPLEGTWAPGYYYVLFEDPDGIRLEVKLLGRTTATNLNAPSFCEPTSRIRNAKCR